MSAAALVSIHDVMPATLPRVERILARCQDHGIGAVTLLVVPGRDWPAPALEQLRAWQAGGYELAAHGWSHQAVAPRGLYHRLHARLVSRACAEHLSRGHAEVLATLRASHAWFARHGLAPPSLYVPPAWAKGPIGHADLARLPCSHLETLTGMLGPRGLYRLPLVGYEADTPARAAALRASNAVARRLGALRPLRIAIHPHDPELRLARDLERDLARTARALLHHDLPGTRGLAAAQAAAGDVQGRASTPGPGR